MKAKFVNEKVIYAPGRKVNIKEKYVQRHDEFKDKFARWLNSALGGQTIRATATKFSDRRGGDWRPMEINVASTTFDQHGWNGMSLVDDKGEHYYIIKDEPIEFIKGVSENVNEGFATEEGRNLDRIAGWLGYDDLHEMLGDNPGLYDAAVSWIDETFSDQFSNEGFNPEELEKVGLYYSAGEAQRIQDEEDVDDEEDIEESGITGMRL